jgi:hypothetical protein
MQDLGTLLRFHGSGTNFGWVGKREPPASAVRGALTSHSEVNAPRGSRTQARPTLPLPYPAAVDVRPRPTSRGYRPIPGSPLPGIICRSSHALAASSQSVSESWPSVVRSIRIRYASAASMAIAANTICTLSTPSSVQ